MNKNIFIGGAWPYGNNSLHVGHLAALLPGDIIARYYRAVGDNVIYVSGTDSHGTPITVRAKKENRDPKEIATHYHNEFAKNFADLDFSYDLYTSTMTDYHEKHVQEYLKKIMANGYIYPKTESQDYCPKCQTFLSDREIVGICPHCGKFTKGDQCCNCMAPLSGKELTAKKCSICGSNLIEKPNTHLYFALSKFQDRIEKLVQERSNTWRVNAISETNKFLNMGLIDRALTRQLTWGIDVPFDGYEDKKVYVWFEAVMGYLTAGRKVAEDRGIDFDQFMKKGNVLSYYPHGKDNIPFHTVIFPAIEMSFSDDINLPDYIVSSEYINMNGEKMSKSAGNLIPVNQLIATFPKDSIRYYFIANGPETKDSNFTIADFVQYHNKFLVGVFGNFVNRNLAFINKKFDGKIPNGTVDQEIVKLTQETYQKIGKLIEEGKLRAATEMSMNYVGVGNKYYDEHKPWVQINEDPQGFANTTATCVYMIANMSNIFAPFMPETCQKIKQKLGIDALAEWKVITLGKDVVIKNNDLLFERLQLE